MKVIILLGILTCLLIAGSSTMAAPFGESTALTTMRGKALQASSFQGKPLVLVFWANWCIPCRKEVTQINTLYQEVFSKNVNFIGINEDEKIEEGLAIIDRYGPQYQSVKDQGFTWAQEMKVKSLPQVIVLSSKGKEIYRGIEPPSLNELQRLIREET